MHVHRCLELHVGLGVSQKCLELQVSEVSTMVEGLGIRHVSEVSTITCLSGI